MKKWCDYVIQKGNCDDIYPCQRPDGELRFVRLFWTPETIIEGEDLAMGLLIDVTEEVNTREELERRTEELTEALNRAELATRFKSEFLAVVSHEIR
jgi:signal transduction histidine kinase